MISHKTLFVFTDSFNSYFLQYFAYTTVRNHITRFLIIWSITYLATILLCWSHSAHITSNPAKPTILPIAPDSFCSPFILPTVYYVHGSFYSQFILLSAHSTHSSFGSQFIPFTVSSTPRPQLILLTAHSVHSWFCSQVILLIIHSAHHSFCLQFILFCSHIMYDIRLTEWDIKSCCRLNVISSRLKKNMIYLIIWNYNKSSVVIEIGHPIYQVLFFVIFYWFV